MPIPPSAPSLSCCSPRPAAGRAWPRARRSISAAERQATSALRRGRTMQALKTGALFRFACEAGAVLGARARRDRAALSPTRPPSARPSSSPTICSMPKATPTALGKAVAKDAERGKATLVALLGAEAARARLAALVAEAEAALAPFGDRAATLKRGRPFHGRTARLRRPRTQKGKAMAKPRPQPHRPTWRCRDSSGALAAAARRSVGLLVSSARRIPAGVAPLDRLGRWRRPLYPSRALG